ncbi:hypothetical protein [Anaeromicrobium sediminis]|uniref:Uncharacterized protein n=1 Tax=Anaeromicrobium sediminis TaxID=1478221 RepID=A0A267MQH0_9FIRM|nr:hypothetical protein [Anaeromicrobium sediminis]PAB61023.1 hypothetical protein CCE28_00915 [Anaeromicrobium sediminis]
MRFNSHALFFFNKEIIRRTIILRIAKFLCGNCGSIIKLKVFHIEQIGEQGCIVCKTSNLLHGWIKKNAIKLFRRLREEI